LNDAMEKNTHIIEIAVALPLEERHGEVKNV
jgi:hypothetical protein